MTKTKCTGCKVFTLCMGDPHIFFESYPILRKCAYCGKLYFRNRRQPTNFSLKVDEVCEGLQDAVQMLFNYTSRSLACSSPKCQRKCCKYRTKRKDLVGTESI